MELPFVCRKCSSCSDRHCKTCVNCDYCNECEEGFELVDGKCVDPFCTYEATHHRDNYCYKVVQDLDNDNAERKTFAEAVDACFNLSSTLTPITSQEESDFLKDAIGDSNTFYWIGARTIISTVGDVVFVEPSLDHPVPSWAANYPQHLSVTREQSIGVKQPEMVWKTRDCSRPLPYICRKVRHGQCDDENCLRCVYPNKCRRCKRGYTLNLDKYTCVKE